MNFIIPEKIGPVLDKMRAIFKTTSTVTLLSQERITRAHKMVTPFVLRRKKKEVRAYIYQQRQPLTSVALGLEGSSRKA